jgi:lysozyme family protein
MSDFALAFERTMQFEDDPHYPGKVTHDAGGRTRFGIADKFHPGLPEEFFTGPADAARAQAEEIELEQYWKPLSLNGIADQAVASKIFDMGVNMGVHQAAVLAQRAVNFLLATRGPQTFPDVTRSVSEEHPPLNSGAQAPSPATHVTSPATRLAEDGAIGANTLEQINTIDPAELLKTLRGFSESHYRHIVTVNPSQAVNLDGWLRRAAA